MNYKRIALATICLLVTVAAVAQEPEKKKILRGFDGGMMVHSGYLFGNLDGAGYYAKGAPFGIGGVIRLHFGEHFRLGSEGYLSTLRQRGNGSYLKYGWGGLLADFYTVLGRFQPYGGLTIGGGAMTTLLMSENPESAWAPINNTRYNKQGFLSVDPFVGFDVIIIGPLHITFKVDYLCPISKSKLLPHGPRAYIGFLFYR